MAGKLVIACTAGCGLHPDKIGIEKANALLALREQGYGQRRFVVTASQLLGFPVAQGTAQRHLKHYKEAAEPIPEGTAPGKKVGDLEILDEIIAAGARNSRNWKPSIKDTLDAMKLKLQITGNSAFEDMLAAMEGGLDFAEGFEDEDGEVAPENPDALGLPDADPGE